MLNLAVKFVARSAAVLSFALSSLTIANCLAAPPLDPQVARIFETRCLECHNSRQAKAGLSLESAKNALEGGESGQVIEPGDADTSLLIDYVSGEDPTMPKIGEPLTAAEIRTLREWIDGGATWPETQRLHVRHQWWSLQPLVRPELPELTSDLQRQVRTPIDVYIISALNREGMHLSPEADRRTLIRRLYFDLIGLPPTPTDVARFADDTDPRAYENLVERLLASPQYGERWARHWLDVVHYGDTMGFDKDKIRPHAWPYRDYVIRSLNDDKPYRRFVQEQLAGDVIFPDSEDGIIALGFIAAGPFDWVGQIEVDNGTMEKARVRNLDRDDMVSSTMSTFVSTTAGCARCHDHKFDPISQRDYYGLQAVFSAVDRANRPYNADPEIERERVELRGKHDELIARKKDLETDVSVVDEPAHSDRAAALAEEIASVESQLAALPEQKLVYAAATEFPSEGQFTQTSGQPRPIHVLERGSEASPKLDLGLVEPCGLTTLNQLANHFDLPNNHSEGARRAALAEWIVDDENPLTWRSIVNRVWQYHFGRGLVESANDFGRMGTLPTHPELLDWLAVEFRDGDQSLKNLHRLICNSATYRQHSRPSDHFTDRDGNNRFLWRMNCRKLDAEEIRDAALFISGKLDSRMGGPGFYTFDFKDDHSPHYKYDEYDPRNPLSHRRSIYRFIVRSAPDPFMTALDCADPSINVGQRTETLTALQALTLLNNRFMVHMAECFAERLAQSGGSTSAQIDAAYRLAINRSPSPQELNVLVELANRHGMANVCRTIFNLNEFIFID